MFALTVRGALLRGVVRECLVPRGAAMASKSPTLLHLPRELDDHCSVAAQELAAKVDAAVSRQQELCLSRLRGNSSAADEAHGRGESLTAAEAAALASASVPERRSSIEPDDPEAQRAAVEQKQPRDRAGLPVERGQGP